MFNSLGGFVARRRVPVLLFHPEKAASPWKDLEQVAGQVVGMPR